MRHLSRVTRRMNIALHRRRQPRWVRPTLMAAGASFGLLAIGGTLVWATSTGALERLSEEIGAHLIHGSAQAGLVISEVYAEGRNHTTHRDVLSKLALQIGQPILGVDTVAMKARLETLPWVSSASVARQLPDRIHIRLVERRPLALWQHRGGYALVDRDGEVVPGEQVHRHTHLPLLVGEDAPRRAAALFAMLSVEPELMGRVRAAILVGGRRWNLRLDHDIDVRLPEHGAEAAWRRLAVKMREDGLLDRAVQSIDLRQADRMILRLRPDALPAKLAGVGA